MRLHLAIIFILLCCSPALAQERLTDFTFFSNSRMEGNYYFSKVFYSNGSYVKNDHKKLPVTESMFHTPGNALEINSINSKDGDWQINLYHNKIRGVDHFKSATHLSFWIYTDSMESELPVIRLMKDDSSMTNPLKGPEKIIPKKWQQIQIPVKNDKSAVEKPEEYIGVVFSQKSRDGSNSSYIVDDVELISPSNASAKPNVIQPDSIRGFYKHVDIYWKPVSDASVKWVKIYRSEDGVSFKPVGIQFPDWGIFTDFTGIAGRKYYYKISGLSDSYLESALSEMAVANTREYSDEELLTIVQRACFNYYWLAAEKNSGLALECLPGRNGLVATGASGFGLMALVVGMERKFIDRQSGIGRLDKIVKYLQKADKFHGAFPHFLNGPTGKTEPFFGTKDNGADLVETSFLMQGLLAARQYLDLKNKKEKEISRQIETLWRNVEWNWFKQTSDSKYLYWHWSPDQGWVIHHPLIGFNETMITYLLAIASPTYPVSASMYYSGFASQDTLAQKYRGWGGSPDGLMYTNGNSFFGIKLPVGVSNGGPLFFTHYSYMGWDPKSITDKYTNYFDNNQAIATINYRYSLENPKNELGIGPGGWGFTASDGPGDYSADEPKINKEDGKITPTGAIASMPYLPKESMRALKIYYNDYGKFLWGEYGFRDACNLQENWCSEIFMGLNQAPMTVMIENYRTGLIWNLFMRNPDIQNGLKKLNKETELQKLK